ncbi:hypothetical protein TNCV_4073541 [Trichonephila clavipes]|uniref:Uncharacterized protein n=1 Tax=Trichonephila clavipes TaxID=2585209 RepID=A0A8X6W9F9_TRICX|nr:hypothetical protein TNCV_4073541 [Trichonephila clavipes]
MFASPRVNGALSLSLSASSPGLGTCSRCCLATGSKPTATEDPLFRVARQPKMGFGLLKKPFPRAILLPASVFSNS